MARVQTSVMIDEDKRELAKQRGIKLQDLLDDALNMALDLEVPGKAQLEIEKENILKEIEFIEKQKEDYLEKYQRNINDLNIRLKYINKQIAGANEEQRELEQQKEREALIERGVREGGINDELMEEMTQYCLKYKIRDINQEIAIMGNDINERWRSGN